MTKADIYRSLARVYKFTPAQIADMTPFQQLTLMDEDGGSGTIYMETMAEYQEWKKNHKR